MVIQPQSTMFPISSSNVYSLLSVHAAVGDDVVGVSVGVLLGEEKGALDGRLDGKVDGGLLGEEEGVEDGEPDGRIVGELLGEIDGTLVGRPVGEEDGVLVGDDVGEEVGRSVGGLVVGAYEVVGDEVNVGRQSPHDLGCRMMYDEIRNEVTKNMFETS